VTATLQNNPTQLNNEISRTLEMGHEAQIRITNLVQQAAKKTYSGPINTRKSEACVPKPAKPS